MNIVKGKIAVRETGIGVAGLIVTALDVGKDGIPNDLLKHEEYKQIPYLWQEVEAVRLGSTVTDTTGEFEISYDDTQLGKGSERPNLALYVTGPEGAGGESGIAPLYSSATIRRNAGRLEQYVIHLPITTLQEADLRIPGMPEPLVSAAQFEGVMADMQQVDRIFLKRRGDGKKFSEWYRDRQQRKEDEPELAQRPPLSFVTPLLLQAEENEDILPNTARLEYDEKSSHFVLRIAKDDKPIPIKFAGVRNLETVEEPGKMKPRENYIIVDQKNKQFHICVADSPSVLRLPNGGSSPLYTWYQNTSQRREDNGEDERPNDFDDSEDDWNDDFRGSKRGDQDSSSQSGLEKSRSTWSFILAKMKRK